MKKIIFFNILITSALFPYTLERWMNLPYSEGIWNMETMVFFGTLSAGSALSISNILLLISMKWTKHKVLFLKWTMIFSAVLFIFPIYTGVIIGYEGGSIWVDILALGILYGNLWLSNQVFGELASVS